MAACSGAVHSFCLLSSLLPTAYLKDGMKFNCTLCAALSSSACPSSPWQNPSDVNTTACHCLSHAMPHHAMPSRPVPSHPISSREHFFCQSQVHGHAGRVYWHKICVLASLPQRRRKTRPWSAPLCAEVGLLLDTVGTHLLPVRVQTTHHLSFSVGGSRYYFGGLCKPPQIICKLLVICK